MPARWHLLGGRRSLGWAQALSRSQGRPPCVYPVSVWTCSRKLEESFQKAASQEKTKDWELNSRPFLYFLPESRPRARAHTHRFWKPWELAHLRVPLTLTVLNIHMCLPELHCSFLGCYFIYEDLFSFSRKSLLFPQDGVSLCKPGWSETHSVIQAAPNSK